MPLFDQAFHAATTDVVGWVCVVCGLAVYAAVLGLAERRIRPEPADAAPPSAATRDLHSDWESVAVKLEAGAARLDAMLETHERARRQIAALEYAWDRLRVDYGHLLSQSSPRDAAALATEPSSPPAVRPASEPLAA